MSLPPPFILSYVRKLHIRLTHRNVEDLTTATHFETDEL